MNFLDSRLKFHATSLLVALFLTLSIVLSRYGYGTLEDNLVAQLYTSYDSEAQFLAFYTVINCYGILRTVTHCHDLSERQRILLEGGDRGGIPSKQKDPQGRHLRAKLQPRGEVRASHYWILGDQRKCPFRGIFKGHFLLKEHLRL